MKNFIKVLALILAFVCIFSLAACTSEDSDDDKKDKGGKNNSALKDDDDDECSHSFGEWKITEPADCSNEGLRVRKCSKCGESEKEDIPMTEHDFGEYSITKEATCKAAGTKTRKCTICQESETVTIPKAEHNYGAGGNASKCSVCGEANYSVGTQGLLFTLQKANNNDPYPDTYKVSVGTAILATNIVIPSTYKGVAVTYIDEEGFTAAEMLVSISIPASVKKIGDNAFVDCTNLESVVFQSGSQLETMTGFYRCTALTSIRVPASVTRVDASAFRGCTALNAIYFDDTANWYCGYMGTPDSDPADVTDSGKNANTFKYSANNYYYFKLVTPED